MKCTCGQPMRQHIISLDDIWWICLICGRQKPYEQPAVKPENLPKEENSMSGSKYGTCPVCERENVLMPGPKCSRCYDRIRQGKDVITGKLLDAADNEKQRADLVNGGRSVHEKNVKQSVAKPEVPAINPQITIVDAYTINPVEVLDASWMSLRASWIRQLSEASTPAERLVLSVDMMSKLQAIGC